MRQDIPKELELILNAASSTDQLLPADALYVLREGIQLFNQHERKISQLLMNGANIREGEWCVARFTTTLRIGLDEKLLFAKLGDLSPYKKSEVYPVITLQRNKS